MTTESIVDMANTVLQATMDRHYRDHVQLKDCGDDCLEVKIAEGKEDKILSATVANVARKILGEHGYKVKDPNIELG